MCSLWVLSLMQVACLQVPSPWVPRSQVPRPQATKGRPQSRHRAVPGNQRCHQKGQWFVENLMTVLLPHWSACRPSTWPLGQPIPPPLTLRLPKLRHLGQQACLKACAGQETCCPCQAKSTCRALNWFG